MSSKSLRAIHNSRKQKLEDLRQKIRAEEFNIKLMFQEYNLLVPSLISFFDNRYKMLEEIKKEEAILETPDMCFLRVEIPTELFQKFKCYTTDRGTPMSEIIRKWVTDYTLYCESEYKRIFSAKLEQREEERAAHLRDCRRSNAKKQWEAKRNLRKNEQVFEGDIEESICTNPKCNKYLGDHGWRDEQNRVFCTEKCLKEYEAEEEKKSKYGSCYNCEQPLTGEIFRDEKNRVFCSDVCQSFMEGVDV